jgi:Uma2 family endonuclease
VPPASRILTTNGACPNDATTTRARKAPTLIFPVYSDHLLSFEEYLKFEEASDVRHDFVHGHVYAYPESSARHNLMVVDAMKILYDGCRGTNLRVFAQMLKLRVSPQVTYYPDVMVAGDPTDNHAYYRTSPSLIVEVVSPCSLLIDRREKVLAYMGISSLQGYLMVYRDEYRVEAYTRRSDSTWDYQRLTTDNDVWIPVVDLTVLVRDFYREVETLPVVPSPIEWDVL